MVTINKYTNNFNIDFLEGQLILIDKPINWTSFDVVKKIKNLIQKKYNLKKIKVGHCGTLDPLATGLIIIATGKATKKLTQLQILDKEYVAEIKFGSTTPSFDLETEIDKEYNYNHISQDSINKILYQFIGENEQVPPRYSAKKINGKRAYVKARKGENFVLKATKIKIYKIDILEYRLPIIKLNIICSKGTYIRSLARDIGFALNSGAHLTALKRMTIGDYNINDAFSIKKFENYLKNI